MTAMAATNRPGARDWSRHLVRRVTFPLYHGIKGQPILRRLAELERSQFEPAERLAELRLEKLRRLLRHAYRNTAYYRHRFDEAGFDPERVRGFDDLLKLPLLTKSDIVAHLGELVAANLPPAAVHRTASGGSTGRQVPFYRDDRCLSFKKAVEFRFNRWTGWDVGRPIAYFWPAIQDFAAAPSWKSRVVQSWVTRSLMLYSGRLDERALAHYAEQLCDYRPFLIRAFPNPLALLARYLESNPRYRARPHAVISTGEPLLAHQKELFERVFDCSVYNLYASRECGHVASECDYHHGLHVAIEGLHVEVVRDGRPAAPGELGDLIVTDLENQGMPFIRYQIEDIGALSPDPCPCGRSLPLLTFEAGRVSDFLVSPHDGSYVSGASLCHYLIAEGPDVGQLQIIQDEADHLTLKIRRSSAFPESDRERLDRLTRTLREIFRGSMRYTVEFVDVIPHEPSGKYRFCVNRVRPSVA
jgi:phenylacetate-CoA ligase